MPNRTAEVGSLSYLPSLPSAPPTPPTTQTVEGGHLRRLSPSSGDNIMDPSRCHRPLKCCERKRMPLPCAVVGSDPAGGYRAGPLPTVTPPRWGIETRVLPLAGVRHDAVMVKLTCAIAGALRRQRRISEASDDQGRSRLLVKPYNNQSPHSVTSRSPKASVEAGRTNGTH